MYFRELILHHIIIWIQLMQFCCRVMYLTPAFAIRLCCTHEKPEMCRDKSVLSETTELASHFFFCSSASSSLSLDTRRVLTAPSLFIYQPPLYPSHSPGSQHTASLYCDFLPDKRGWNTTCSIFLCLISADRVYELQSKTDNRVSCERVLIWACTK